MATNRPRRGVSQVKRQRAKELRHRQTAAETILWERLRRNQLHGLHFRRQEPLAGFIADFYCHDARFVIEVDGSIHAQVDQVGYDAARDEVLTTYGLQVMRVTNAEIQGELESVLKRIAAECIQRINMR
jgi:very-short-patch-repair endonuclease